MKTITSLFILLSSPAAEPANYVKRESQQDPGSPSRFAGHARLR